MSLVATIALLFPFADLGIGATVLSASAHAGRTEPGSERRRRHSSRLPRAVRAWPGCSLWSRCASWRSTAGALSSASPAGPTIGGRSPSRRASSRSPIPAGLGVRILIGIDRNPLATLVLMSCPAFALGLTLLLYLSDVERNLVRSVVLGRLAHRPDRGHGARRCACPDWAGRRLPACPRLGPGPGLLAGSMWLFARGGRAASRLADRAGSARAPVNAGGAVPLRLDGTDLRRLLAGVVHRRVGVLADLRQEAGSHRRDGSNVVATHRRRSPRWR